MNYLYRNAPKTTRYIGVITAVVVVVVSASLATRMAGQGDSPSDFVLTGGATAESDVGTVSLYHLATSLFTAAAH